MSVRAKNETNILYWSADMEGTRETHKMMMYGLL